MVYDLVYDLEYDNFFYDYMIFYDYIFYYWNTMMTYLIHARTVHNVTMSALGCYNRHSYYMHS